MHRAPVVVAGRDSCSSENFLPKRCAQVLRKLRNIDRPAFPVQIDAIVAVLVHQGHDVGNKGAQVANGSGVVALRQTEDDLDAAGRCLELRNILRNPLAREIWRQGAIAVHGGHLVDDVGEASPVNR